VNNGVNELVRHIGILSGIGMFGLLALLGVYCGITYLRIPGNPKHLLFAGLSVASALATLTTGIFLTYFILHSTGKMRLGSQQYVYCDLLNSKNFRIRWTIGTILVLIALFLTFATTYSLCPTAP
jgi:hypothetical protein